jgi:hypothetical protein
MARDSDTYIFRKGVTPNTLSVISSKNRIYAYNAKDAGALTQIGVVATFDPSEARTIEPVRGIGFGDHIAELVPGVTDPMTISVTRTALYLSNIYQVFGYKSGVDGIVRSLRHHKWPFDIRQEIIFSNLANRTLNGTQAAKSTEDPTKIQADDLEYTDVSSVQALITLYEACWMSDYSISFASDSALVQESVTINVSDVLNVNWGEDLNFAQENDLDTLSTQGAGLSKRLTVSST